MNVFRQEFRMSRLTMLVWIIALVLVTTMFVSLFPAFSNDIEASRKLLENFPPQLRAAFGLSLSSFFTFLGFYAYTFTYIGLAGAIQAMNLGLISLSREASAHTTDFLLTKPISRSRIFVAKLSSALLVLIITNLVLTSVTLLLTQLFSTGSFNMNTFLLLNLAFGIVQIIFLAIGMLVSQLVRKVKSSIALTLGIVFGFFAIGLLQATTNDDTLRYLTPFKYFDHMKVVSDGAYQPQFVWLSAALVIVAIAVSFFLYTRRDARSIS